jgi:hypothetical protein
MNTITANELKTHLYIVAADGMEGENRLCRAKAGIYLINQYVKNNISFPKAPQAFTKSPCCFFKR